MLIAAVNERTSARFLGTLRDEQGLLVGPAALEQATLSLYAIKSGAIVNGRNGVNILNTNGWTFYDTLQSTVVDGQTVSYNVVGLMTPADAAVLDDTLKTESHMAEIKLVWAGGTRGATHRFRVNVANLTTVQ